MPRLFLLVLAMSWVVLGSPAISPAVDLTYFDATNSLIDPSNPVGTQWHELYPNYCRAPYTITGWKDNGDGVLSFCDTLSMTNPEGFGMCVHVVDVTITLELTRVNPPDVVPHFWDWIYGMGGEPLPAPVCTWWSEIYPDFGSEFHIAGWDDNGSGMLDFCDLVFDDAGASYHVEDVHTDMVTEPADECAVDPGTWGRIKTLFR